MSDTKVYQFGETGSGTLNSLLPLLQQRGIDPAYLAGDIAMALYPKIRHLICDCHKHPYPYNTTSTTHKP